MTEPAWLEVGRVVGAQGMRGEVRIYPNSDFPERFLQPGQRWLRRSPSSEVEAIELVHGRLVQGKGLYVVQFEEIRDRTSAENLTNAVLLVPESDRPALEAGEFFVADLIGLRVILRSSQAEIGTVVDLYSAGNDLLAVQLHAGATEAAPPVEYPESDSPGPQAEPTAEAEPKSEARSKAKSKAKAKAKLKKPLPLLIPFVNEIVPVVDLEQGYLEIDPPAGLLEG
jgi:16S rRNA processing protein RimM